MLKNFVYLFNYYKQMMLAENGTKKKKKIETGENIFLEENNHKPTHSKNNLENFCRTFAFYLFFILLFESKSFIKSGVFNKSVMIILPLW